MNQLNRECESLQDRIEELERKLARYVCATAEDILSLEMYCHAYRSSEHHEIRQNGN